MFNFKDQYNKVSQKQCSNSVKNLRKELPKQSPFSYGSKKISFNVKNRSEYWDDIEKVYVNEQARIDSIIGNVLQNLMNGKDTDYDIADSVMYSPVSPVLAVTLVMLNKALFRCKIFSDYMESDEAQVYAYTHWNGKNFVTNPTALVIDNPFGNETEKYKKILPGYSKISAMNFYKGYQVYVTDYSSNSPVSSTTAAVSNDSKYWGSYHIDTKRFQRVFATKPDLDRVESGSIVSNVTFKDSEGMEVETLNMHPELDSYLYADGIFKKLMDSPYNSQSYQISVLRGGYGFGPINIACFLKAKEFDIERITDIISGLLIAEDSGMPLIDAIRGIQEWRISVHDTDIDTIFDSLSDIRILRYIEYIGSIFFTAILGSSLKEKPLINIPLTSVERKIYDVGYLMGHNYDIFVQMFKNGIKNKIWLKDSTEIFSFEVPCVLYGTEPTTGIFKIGDYVKNYSDSLLLGSEPLDYAFNVSSILEKEKALTDYITPKKGYTIFDFVTKGLNNCLITEILKNIDRISQSKNFIYNYYNNGLYRVQENDIELLGNSISGDLLIAPRKERNIIIDNDIPKANYHILSQDYDDTKCVINYNVESSYNYICQNIEAIYQDDWNVVLIRMLEKPILSIKYSDSTNYVTLSVNGYSMYSIQFDIDGNQNNQLYLKKGYEIWIENVKYTVIENSYVNFKYVESTNTITDISTSSNQIISLTDVVALDESNNVVHLKIENIKIFETNTSLNTLSNYSVILDNHKYYNEYNLNHLTQKKNEIYSRKIRSLNIINLQNNIYSLFNACGFYLNFDIKYENGMIKTEEDELYNNMINFLNRFSLCILKLSTVNAFCTSYSIDLQSLPDSTRSFYDIYKSYLGDFIEIKQEIQN